MRVASEREGGEEREEIGRRSREVDADGEAEGGGGAEGYESMFEGRVKCLGY